MHINGHFGELLNRRSGAAVTELPLDELTTYEAVALSGDPAATLHRVASRLLLSHSLTDSADNHRITSKLVSLDEYWYMDLNMDRTDQLVHGDEAAIQLGVWPSSRMLGLSPTDAFLEYTIRPVVALENTDPMMLPASHMRVLLDTETPGLCVDILAAFKELETGA